MTDRQYINPYKLFNGGFIPNWLMERKSADLTPNAKLVYARLLQYAGEDGAAYPKLETIGKGCGLSLTSIKRVVRELCDLGLLERIRRGLQKSNMYLFPYHNWMEMKVDKASFKQTLSEDPQEDHTAGTSLHIEDKTNKTINNNEVPEVNKKRVSIEQWEKKNGTLSLDHPDLINWIEEKNLSEKLLSVVLEDFKTQSIAKGYKYISFPAAFKSWCNSTQYGRPGLSAYKKTGGPISAIEAMDEEINKWN